ncbi:Lsr2 dimerization domain-containing protein [Nocardia brasiliensis]
MSLVYVYDGESPAEETVTFGIDDVSYEIDPSSLKASSLCGIYYMPARRSRSREQEQRGEVDE